MPRARYIKAMAESLAESRRPPSVSHFQCRWAPLSRVLIVACVAGLTSVGFHIAIARALDTPPGQVPSDQGVAYFVYGPVVAAIVIGVLLAVLRVGRTWAIWLPAAPLGLVVLGLTAYLLAQSHVSSWARGLGIPGLTAFVILDSLTVALTFGLASLVSDSRLPRRVRFGLPIAVFGLTGALWGLIYLVVYHH